MNEQNKSDKNISKLPNKRFTKKPFPFMNDHEIIYLYRNFIFNERLNDKLNLEYDLNEDNSNTLSEANFNLYPNLPKKLSFYKLWKFRYPIKNFIIYNYSIKGKTFVERKILKEAKQDIHYIFMKRHTLAVFISGIILSLFTRSLPIFGSYLFLLYLNEKNKYLSNFYFFLNYNEILMKFQINPKFKLGRETIEFFKYLNSNLDKKSILKRKDYYDKFFVKDIYEIKFEPDDELIDYLVNNKYNFNFHQEFLKILEKSNKK